MIRLATAREPSWVWPGRLPSGGQLVRAKHISDSTRSYRKHLGGGWETFAAVREKLYVCLEEVAQKVACAAERRGHAEDWVMQPPWHTKNL